MERDSKSTHFGFQWKKQRPTKEQEVEVCWSGTWGHGLVLNMEVVLGWQLDVVVLEVFSSLKNFMILCLWVSGSSSFHGPSSRPSQEWQIWFSLVLHYVKSLSDNKVSLHLLWDKQECHQIRTSQNFISYRSLPTQNILWYCTLQYINYRHSNYWTLEEGTSNKHQASFFFFL